MPVPVFEILHSATHIAIPARHSKHGTLKFYEKHLNTNTGNVRFKQPSRAHVPCVVLLSLAG